MSATGLTTDDRRDAAPTLPDELDSSTAKLVYMYLATAEGGTVEELHDALGLSNISLYPILDSLAGRDLIVRDGKEYRPCGD